VVYRQLPLFKSTLFCRPFDVERCTLFAKMRHISCNLGFSESQSVRLSPFLKFGLAAFAARLPCFRARV
jgi:hypothetical protein